MRELIGLVVASVGREGRYDPGVGELGNLWATRHVALGVGAEGALHARAPRKRYSEARSRLGRAHVPVACFRVPSRVGAPSPDPQRHDDLCRGSLAGGARQECDHGTGAHADQAVDRRWVKATVDASDLR